MSTRMRVLGLIELYYSIRMLWREYRRNRHVSKEKHLQAKIRKDDDKLRESRAQTDDFDD